MYEVDRRGLMNIFHEGAIIFVLMVICIVSALVVYGWLTSLVQAWWPNDTGPSQVCIPGDMTRECTVARPKRRLSVLLHMR